MTDRELVSQLIRYVLIEQLSVREAILQFPRDTKDRSIQAAYHALVHFEADEDLRNRDEAYKDEQDDYLEYISQTLEKNEDLPNNIIKNYEKYYETANLIHDNTPKGFLYGFFKFLNVK